LEESKRCPEIETRFVATDETGKHRGTLRHGDFYEGRVTVIKGRGFGKSSEGETERGRQTDVVQGSQKVFRKAVQ
jgi:hypothetical protein